MIKFTYITTLEDYTSAINTLSAYPELAMDTETYALKQYGSKASALDPHTGRISLLQLKGSKGKTYIFDIIWLTELSADFSLLIKLLQSREYLLLHNAK